MRVNLARLVFNQSCSCFSGLSPEVGDHLVDVVFEHRYLALRLDRDRPRQIPLVTAVATSAIARTWVVKLAASSLTLSVKSPSTSCTRHLSLSAQLTFDPDFATSLDRQRLPGIDHFVDGICKVSPLPIEHQASSLHWRPQSQPSIPRTWASGYPPSS